MKRCFFTVCLMTMLLLMCTETNAQWKQLEVGPSGQVWSLGIAGNSIFAGTFAGIYRSTNQGQSWTNVSPYFANCFAVKGAEILAGTEYNGLVRSTDGGITWAKTDSSITNDINAMAIIGNYIIAGGGAVMLRSSDDGSSWTLIQNGLISGQTTVTGMVVTEGKVIASTFAGVVVSSDSGDSWSTLVSTNQSDQVTNCVGVIDSTVLVGWPGGIIRSTDDGRTWIEPGGWINTSTTFSIVGDSSRIYAGTVTGVHVSTDGGITWTPMNNGLPGNQAWYLVKNNGDLYAASGDDGVYLSSDSASSWVHKSQGISGWSGDYIAGNGEDVFATMSNPTTQLLYHSTDNGNAWVEDTSWHDGSIQSMTFISPYIYAITDSEMFRSSDDGYTWDEVTIDTLASYTPLALVKSGVNLVLETSGGVFLSSDGGVSWTIVQNSPPATTLCGSGDNVFAATQAGIYRSTDYGENWTEINDTLNDIAFLVAIGSNVIAGRPMNPGGGGANPGPPPTPGAVFRSTDNGQTWTSYMTGLPDNPQVLSLTTQNSDVFVGLEEGYPGEFDYANVNQKSWIKGGQSLPASISVFTVYASDSSVFVGTSQGGIWSRPLSQITGIKRTSMLNLPGSFILEQNYPNPFNPTTVISYKLSALSHVKLDVYNVLGQKVVELVNKEEPEGTYKVTFNAGSLASGVYFYRLKAGNFVDTKKLVLLK